MDLSSRAYTAFGITINLNKIRFIPPPGQPYVNQTFSPRIKRLDMIYSFVYLGSTHAKMDSLIRKKISRSNKLAKPSKSLKVIYGLTNLSSSKPTMENLSILSCLSDTWTTYCHHMKALERFMKLILGGY